MNDKFVNTHIQVAEEAYVEHKARRTRTCSGGVTIFYFHDFRLGLSIVQYWTALGLLDR